MSNFWSKNQVLGFIEVYRSNECLWKLKDKNYTSKSVREKAYEQLVDYVRTFDKEANKDSVLKRIHNMRGSFRKELKKVKSSGFGADEIYTPKLWYFHSLYFLKEQEIPGPSQSSIAVLETNSTRVSNIDYCHS